MEIRSLEDPNDEGAGPSLLNNGAVDNEKESSLVFSGHNKSWACLAYGSFPAPSVSWWIDDRFQLDNHQEVNKLFFDRELCSKVLSVVVLGVESSSKTVPNRAKVVQENKKCAREQKKCSSVAHYGIELSCLPCMALCGLVCIGGHGFFLRGGVFHFFHFLILLKQVV